MVDFGFATLPPDRDEADGPRGEIDPGETPGRCLLQATAPAAAEKDRGDTRKTDEEDLKVVTGKGLKRGAHGIAAAEGKGDLS